MQVEYYPQPVFSSPNAVDHADNHLMGIMLPTSATTHVENDPTPRHITPFPRGSKIGFEAEIAIGKGTSVDALADYVKRHGLPEPPKPRKELEEQLTYIVEQYDGHFWYDQKVNTGWALRTVRDMIRQPGQEEQEVHTHVAGFLERYVREYPGALADRIAEKLEKAKAKTPENPQYLARNPLHMKNAPLELVRAYGDGLLALQSDDGYFRANPDDPRSAGWRPGGIAHWPFAENIYKAMTTIGDIVTEINVVSAWHLMSVSEVTGDPKYAEAAYKALDQCMDMLVANGGDAWETPLQSPNLLATGHAAIAYELAYRRTGKPEYRQKAIHWLRGLLVFTKLWEPKNNHGLYNTKPCFCVTDWATTSWVDAEVEWEVIEILSNSHDLGIDWAEVDPEIDWHRYEEGIACSTTWWMLDSSLTGQYPFDIDLELGNLDGVFADQHDPVTNELLGWQLMPDRYAELIMNVLARKQN